MMLFILVLLSACTYHAGPDGPVTPVSYPMPPHRNADSIGILRRLAIMPMDIIPLSGPNSSEPDLTRRAVNYETECANYLSSVKGYEVVLARNVENDWRQWLSAEDGYGSDREAYRKWRSGAEQERTRSVVGKIGRAMQVDGIIVMRMKERKPWNAFDGILNIALMNIPLVVLMSKSNIGAYIFETDSGRMVWRTEQSTFGSEEISYGRALTGLFFDMENAVPRQLIE
ncbi:MAG: hypothetical protein PVH87_08155 [Desulfobacteraceae bacterium]